MPGIRAALARKLRRKGAAARTLRTADVSLMQATTGEPFDREGWIFELKYDGFRVLAGNEAGRPRLRYRGGSEATAAFPEVAAALSGLPGNVVLDGELVVVDEAGRTHFQRMQKRLMLRPSRLRPLPAGPVLTRNATAWRSTRATRAIPVAKPEEVFLGPLAAQPRRRRYSQPDTFRASGVSRVFCWRSAAFRAASAKVG
jgi:hypothetical protein